MYSSVKLGPPVRFVTMGVFCILGLIYLPNAWWGIIIKLLLGVWLLGTIKGAFSDAWYKYETLGAFVTIQIAAITATIVFMNIPVVTFATTAISLLGWIVMIKRIKKANHDKLPY